MKRVERDGMGEVPRRQGASECAKVNRVRRANQNEGTCRRMRLGWEFQVHRRSVRRDGGDVLDLM